MNNINLYIDSLKQIATNKRLNSLKYRKLEGAEIYGSIKKLNGTYVDLSDLKGKTLILNFISSWCGPCQLIYPSLEKIYLENKSIDNKSVENKDSNNLEILTIDIWEQSQDIEEVLAEMLKKIPVALPFYIDETDLLPTRYGVTGLPTFIFVDKNGKIQFIERGFSNEFEFLRDTKDKIKLLN
jgi:thiol-disulfide isomerase/thioredoxin